MLENAFALTLVVWLLQMALTLTDGAPFVLVTMFLVWLLVFLITKAFLTD